ncbi:hypothetical protein DPSP01_012609 [Paraphaeosphaeria sporulosa]
MSSNHRTQEPLPLPEHDVFLPGNTSVLPKRRGARTRSQPPAQSQGKDVGRGDDDDAGPATPAANDGTSLLDADYRAKLRLPPRPTPPPTIANSRRLWVDRLDALQARLVDVDTRFDEQEARYDAMAERQLQWEAARAGDVQLRQDTMEVLGEIGERLGALEERADALFKTVGWAWFTGAVVLPAAGWGVWDAVARWG